MNSSFENRPPAIDLRGVSRRYKTSRGDVHALRDVHLQIARGEIFGIIGRSGAGKSTLLRTFNLLERPDSGDIIVDGEDVMAFDGEQVRRLRQRVTMVFQHFNQLNSKTVAENVRLPLRIAATLPRLEQERRVREILELVGIADQAHKYPARLSGGQRQRVGIARALVAHPDIVLCDEATSALDPQTTRSILSLLLEINRRLRPTLVLITHSMDVVRAIADRVAVIEAGAIVESGPVAEVFLRPRHAVTRALLAESSSDVDAAEDAIPHGAGRIARITYQGDASHRRTLSRLSLESGLELGLLKGSVGRFKDVSYGQFTIEVDAATDEQLARLAAAARRLAVHCEMLH